MSLFDAFKKKDDKPVTIDPFAFIADPGTRNAVKGGVGIVVPAIVMYAVAKGLIPENQSQAAIAKLGDMMTHAIEAVLILYPIVSAWRRAHTHEREVKVASAMPPQTPREEIHSLAKQLDSKDIAAMMPPPELPR